VEYIVKDPRLAQQTKEHYSQLSEEVVETRILGRSSLSKRFRRILKDTQAVKLTPKNNIISISGNDSISDAFKKLVENNILSLPVHEDDHFLGFLDILDILSFLISKLGKESEKKEVWENWVSLKNFSNTSCKNITNMSGRNPPIVEKGTSSLQSVIDLIGAENNFHRIGILNDEGKVTSLISQFRILQFLSEHGIQTEMGNLATSTIGQLRLGFKKVVTVDEDTKSLEAFTTLLNKEVSGLGVTSKDGKLIGHLSASDLKDIGYDMLLFGKLFVSVGSFLKQKLDGTSAPPPLTVSHNTTIKELLQDFISYGVHRFFIEDKGTLLGIISPIDVLRCFMTPKHLK
jgi:CBS domain-containing protein